MGINIKTMMKHFTITLLVLWHLLPSALFAQTEDIVQKDSLRHRWSVGISGSVDHHVYAIQQSNGDGLDNRHFYYTRDLYYSYGVMLSYEILKKIKISVGFINSEHGYNSYTNPYTLPPYVKETSPTERQFIIRNVGIPMIGKYFWENNSSITPILLAGVIPAIPSKISRIDIYADKQLTEQSGYWGYNKNQLGFITDPWNLNIRMVFGFGIEYNGWKHLLVTIESTYSYYLVNVNKGRFTSNTQTFSLQIGVGYKF